MNPVAKATAFGALVGVGMMLMMTIFRVHAPLVLDILWPTRMIGRANPAAGEFWYLLFAALKLLGNVALYALIGFVIGKLMYPKESSR